MSDHQEAVTRIQAVKEAHEQKLLAKANVVGVGIGLRQRNKHRSDEVVLVVMVAKKVARARLAPDDIIPREIDGVPVDIQAVGQITTQTDTT